MARVPSLPMEESAPTINIVISDDHALFREGLRKLLEAEPGIQIVGEAVDEPELAGSREGS